MKIQVIKTFCVSHLFCYPYLATYYAWHFWGNSGPSSEDCDKDDGELHGGHLGAGACAAGVWPERVCGGVDLTIAGWYKYPDRQNFLRRYHLHYLKETRHNEPLVHLSMRVLMMDQHYNQFYFLLLHHVHK